MRTKKKNVMRTPEEKEAIVLESLNGWIKDELFIDFNLKKCDPVLSLIKNYINYYNYERPMYCLKYKTPHQYKTDMGY